MWTKQAENSIDGIRRVGRALRCAPHPYLGGGGLREVNGPLPKRWRRRRHNGARFSATSCRAVTNGPVAQILRTCFVWWARIGAPPTTPTAKQDGTAARQRSNALRGRPGGIQSLLLKLSRCISSSVFVLEHDAKYVGGTPEAFVEHKGWPATDCNAAMLIKVDPSVCLYE